MNDLVSFLQPVHTISDKENYNPLQYGKTVIHYHTDSFEWDQIDVVILGCGERRFSTENTNWSDSHNAIRSAFYKMYQWLNDVVILDMGNIIQGATPEDTKAALTTVLYELQQSGKLVIVLGGSQDLTLEQYQAFKKAEKMINVAAIDMLIDLEESEKLNDRSYLMNLLTYVPNFVTHFNLIGFQSYYTNPKLLETLDKLRFDCFRVGKVRENIEDMEPILRDCDLLSIDLNALKHSAAPFLKNASPNGFSGDEMCQLMRYAGMGSHIKSVGIYGYDALADTNGQGAEQVAQMLWYLVEGCHIAKLEADFSRKSEYEEYKFMFSNYDFNFLKSRRTGRWWIQLTENKFIPCSYADYLAAVNNEIPERWIRAHERMGE